MARVEGPYIVDQPGARRAARHAARASAGSSPACCSSRSRTSRLCARTLDRQRAARSLVADFVLSLVPIAFVYVVAHYFSLFVIQGQFAVPLLSDPLGRGWDLLGTADVVPNLTVITPNTTWYVQVARARRRARRRPRDRARPRGDDLPGPPSALRSQCALLALMVLYTVGGLWVLSRG